MNATAGLRAAWAVFRKEIVDALRERRTLLVLLASSVLLGPAALGFVLTGVDGGPPERPAVQVAGIEHAPGLKRYIERQDFDIHAAPGDFEQRLRAGTLSEPVVVVPPDFEPALQRGAQPLLEIVSAAEQPGDPGVERVRALLEGFGREHAAAKLASQGLSADALAPVRLTERRLPGPQASSAVFVRLLPFFVLMAVLYGAMSAALDSTAGERERGSLEPLMVNPAPAWAMALGKWGAVAAVAMLVALVSCISFAVGERLLRSDALSAIVRFDARAVGLFLVLLVPFAAALSALLMAVAIRCKTFKEAQASSNIIVLALALLPVIAIFDHGEPTWQLWVPGMAQNILMARVLGGTGLGADGLLVPLAVAAALTAACVAYVAREMRRAALK